MEIHIGERVAELEMLRKEGNKVDFLIDGKPWHVDIVLAENGNCSILHEGHSFNAGLIRSEGGKEYEVSILSRTLHVDIIDNQKKYLRLRRSTGEEEHQDCICAPMPGKVVSIPVSVGQHLEAGDIAIVLEAMKMQSNYKVSAPCRVREILVSEGDTVSTNQRLILFDPHE